MSDNSPVLAKELKFSHVSEFMEKLSDKKTGKNAQDKIAEHFFETLHNFRNEFIKKHGNKNASLYPLIRLILAGEETERTYGMQITTMTKLYLKAAGIPEHSADGQSLLKCHQTELPNTIHRIMKNRHNKESSITVFEVDTVLNAISENKRQKYIETELCRVITISNPLDMKWLAKIILRKLNLNYGKLKLLKKYHPQAADLNMRHKLSRVCELIESGKSADEILSSIDLFDPVSSMLCARFNITELSELTKKELYLDTKYDGERFQLHMKDGEYRYFSRNGHDYSECYGRSNQEGSLTPFLYSQFTIPVHNIILDGEMMIYKKEERKYHTKGEFQMDVKHMKSVDSNFRPCYCVFDILYLNGVSQMKKPFAERMTLLKSLITDKEGVIKRCIPLKIRDVDHVIDLVNQAIDREEEGVVLKEALSTYSAGERNAGWYKIKPDYIDGICVDFDLIVIGGYYYNLQKSSFLYKFILGVVEKLENGEYRVHACGDVNLGLSYQEKASLNDSLKHHMLRASRDHQPTTKFSCGTIEWGRVRPNAWVPPDKSVILEIKAAELYKSSEFKTSHSLRFPRINAIRRDKNWHEACSLQDFNSLINKTNQGNTRKIAIRSVNLDDVQPVAKKRKKQNIPVVSVKQELSEELIKPYDNLLQGREYCVLSSKDNLPSVKELKILIKKRGGKSVEVPNPTKTYAIFVGKITPQIKRYIQGGSYNVVKVEWLVSALNDATINQTCPKLKPLDMIAVNEELLQVFSQSYDEFGSSYFQETNEQELLEIIEKMDSSELPDVSEEDEANLWKEIGADSFSIFRGLKAVFSGDSKELEMAKNIFKIRGGIVIDEKAEEGNVLTFSDSTNFGSGDSRILNWDWIVDCGQSGEILDKEKYLNNL